MDSADTGESLQSMMADVQRQIQVIERVLAAADPARYKSMLDSMRARGLLIGPLAGSGDDDGVGGSSAGSEGAATETDSPGGCPSPERLAEAGT